MKMKLTVRIIIVEGNEINVLINFEPYVVNCKNIRAIWISNSEEIA